MTTKPDGGPAYPGTCDCDAHKLFVAKDGMSLRDWFAGQALDVILYEHTIVPSETAQKAYEIADAMIAERGKRWRNSHDPARDDRRGEAANVNATLINSSSNRAGGQGGGDARQVAKRVYV